MAYPGYYNSFQATRQNVKEQVLEEKRLKQLQFQEDKNLEIWAKKQLRIEQQIDTKQSPLQRARRICIKRQEEINRINSSNVNGVTEHKTCEKRLHKRLYSCHSGTPVQASLEKTELKLAEDAKILRNRPSSSNLLPIIPVKKQTTPSRKNTVPVFCCDPSTLSCQSKLPPINSSAITISHKTKRQTLGHQKLPPLKPNCWI